MTKRDRERLEKALRAFGDASFEAGEWNADEEYAEGGESWERVYARTCRTENRLRAAIGLPLRDEQAPTLGQVSHG